MRLETHAEALYRSTIAQQEARRLARAGRQDSSSFALALKASNPERQHIPTSAADRDALRAQAADPAPRAQPLEVKRVRACEDNPADLFTVVQHVVFHGSAGGV